MTVEYITRHIAQIQQVRLARRVQLAHHKPSHLTKVTLVICFLCRGTHNRVEFDHLGSQLLSSALTLMKQFRNSTLLNPVACFRFGRYALIFHPLAVSIV